MFKIQFNLETVRNRIEYNSTYVFISFTLASSSVVESFDLFAHLC